MTNVIPFLICSTAISTHTLTWSVTILKIMCPIFIDISTHTLTWSVTATACLDFDVPQDFNSHAHVERDDEIVGNFTKGRISTHTLTWSVTADTD